MAAPFFILTSSVRGFQLLHMPILFSWFTYIYWSASPGCFFNLVMLHTCWVGCMPFGDKINIKNAFSCLKMVRFYYHHSWQLLSKKKAWTELFKTKLWFGKLLHLYQLSLKLSIFKIPVKKVTLFKFTKCSQWLPEEADLSKLDLLFMHLLSFILLFICRKMDIWLHTL